MDRCVNAKEVEMKRKNENKEREERTIDNVFGGSFSL